MGILDEITYDISYLSEEHNLIKPVENHAIPGIIPEMIKHSNADPSIIRNTNDYQYYPTLGKKIQECHPSGYDNIILVLVDGLGMQDLSQTTSFLSSRTETHGEIATSTYPSITSTVVTSLIYGVFPSTHHIFGYNIYNEKLDAVWNALRLSYLTPTDEIRAVTDRYDLDQFVSGTPLTQLLRQEGHGVSYLVPDYLRPPGLGTILNPASPQTGYRDHHHLVGKIKQQLSQSSAPQFICAYFPEVDGVAHSMGPNSGEYFKTIDRVEQTIQKILDLPEVRKSNTLVLMTSDHGLESIDPSISTSLSIKQRNTLRRQGTLLSFSGRVIHAYALDDLDKTYDHLQSLIDPRYSMIIEREQALEMTGGTAEHGKRIGDFNIISTGNSMVHVPNPLSLQEETLHLGHHGSLTEREIFVPATILSAEE